MLVNPITFIRLRSGEATSINKAVEFRVTGMLQTLFFFIIDSVTESLEVHLGASPLASHGWSFLAVGLSLLASRFLV